MNALNTTRRFATRILLAALVAVVGVGSAHGQDLHTVSVGITNAPYAGELKATKKDAIDMVKWAKTQQGGLFQQVYAETLTNEDATVQRTLNALYRLKGKVKAGDTTIVYLSAHGGTNQQGEFVFCAYDRHLTWSQIAATLRGLPGTKIVILDTCRAAAIRNPENIIVFSACLAAQNSADGALPEGNSLFTRFLLEALHGKADMNKNGTISLTEAAAYVSGKLESLGGNVQACTLYRPMNIPDAFPISKVAGSTTTVIAARPNLTNVAIDTPANPQAAPGRPVNQINRVAKVAGTTWEGKEDLGYLRFDFQANGKAVMTDAVSPGPVHGTWNQQAANVTVTFANCVYQGTINGSTYSGRAVAGSDGWNFNIVLK